MENISYYLMSAVAALIALTVHEYSHALAAYKLGDGTARSFGRLSLNPMKHLDPIGTISMIFFRVGWARPVPINARNFKNPKRGFALSALAGPLSNILLAVFSALLFVAICAGVPDAYLAYHGYYVNDTFVLRLLGTTLAFIIVFFMANIGLGVFNLLPIPPFDGSRIMYTLLPPKLYFGVMRYERQIYYFVLAWLLLGDMAKTALLSVPLIASSSILSAIAGIFSLSDIISAVILFIANLIFEMWQLIPALDVGIKFTA